jgi:amidase
VAVPDLSFATVVQQREWAATGIVTAREIVEHSLARIAALDSTLNAFAYVLADEALARADELDAARAAGEPCGPLHGVPIAIKDENDVAGLPTAYGGAAFTTPAAADSEVVRLLREAGAIIIGKTRMPEFGIFPYTETSANGWTRNPWNVQKSPAGSSGGTGAAVASGMVAAGIGGDGGGSIRLPASWCGLFGLKPQRGRVSLAPNPDLWRALGVIGPLTRTVADSAVIYDVIAGTTPTDRFSAGAWEGTLAESASAPPKPLRILVSAKNPGGGPKADAPTAAALAAAAEALRALGHTVIERDPKYPNVSLPFMAQVAGGVADEVVRAEHPELLEARTRRISRLIRPALRYGAWAERTLTKKSDTFLASLFADIDLVLMPTTPTAALPVGQLDGLGAIKALRRATGVSSYTSLWNALGNPAAAIPAGFTDDGLPLSVQIGGPANSEPLIVALSAQLEAAMPWAGKRPPLPA